MGTHRTTIARIEALVATLGSGPWPRADLTAMGWSSGQLGRAVAAGLLDRDRRGLYSLRDDQRSHQQVALLPDLGRQRLAALARFLDARAVFSHSTAARLHGMWTPRTRDPLIHVTVPGQSEREDAGVRIHASGLPARHTDTEEGLRVTSIARTSIDLARAGDLSHALVAADSGLRRQLSAAYPDVNRSLRDQSVRAEDVERARRRLDEVAATMTGWPGVRTARAAVAAADPHSESPYESWSRGWITAVNLPRPALNVRLIGASGRVYFGDFVWPDHRVVGEADGVGKYGTSSDEIRSSLRAERDRQLDLERAGWRVVRWVVGESGATIVSRLSRALRLSPGVTARSVEKPA